MVFLWGLCCLSAARQGGGFGSESGIGIAFRDGVFVPTVFDNVLGVVLPDVCPDLFDVTGDFSLHQFQFFEFPDGLFQQGLEEGVLHPLDFLSEVAIGGDEVFPVGGGVGKGVTAVFGMSPTSRRDGSRWRGTRQDDPGGPVGGE